MKIKGVISRPLFYRPRAEWGVFANDCVIGTILKISSWNGFKVYD